MKPGDLIQRTRHPATGHITIYSDRYFFRVLSQLKNSDIGLVVSVTNDGHEINVLILNNNCLGYVVPTFDLIKVI